MNALNPRRPVGPPAPLRPPLGAGLPPGDGAARFGLVGRHPLVRRVHELIERVAPDPSPVLIRGESGTGKELVAEALHGCSSRAGGALVKVNCGALTDTLLASALFGHERGAFTGAVERTRGCFEAAHGGTLFLDEIGEVSPRTQVALLRVLEERRVTRLGSSSPVDVDVRVVCATNRDLEVMVERSDFREDLYYRLEAIRIELPPLREHPEDVPLIAAHLLARIAAARGTAVPQLDEEAATWLAALRWPGNVRQLDNVLRAASLFCDGDRLGRGDVEAPGRRHNTPCGPLTLGALAWARVVSGEVGLRELQAEIEADCLHRALELSGGNIARAAKLLRMKRPRVSQLVKAHGIPRVV